MTIKAGVPTVVMTVAMVVSGHAQSAVTAYLRASPPAPVYVLSTTGTTPEKIVTGTSFGNYASGGFSIGDVIGIWGVCTGSTPSAVNGVRKVSNVSTTHVTNDTYTITDLAGTNIVTNGAFLSCSGSGNPAAASWVSKLTAFTLQPGINGWFDGPAGYDMRRLSLGPLNGLGTLSLTGCPSACVLTVPTSFDPTAMGALPVAAGNIFATWGTSQAAINSSQATTINWTVATATSSGWVSQPKAVSGSSNGTLSANMNCGPQASPNGTLGTSQDCTRVSLLAYQGNPMWDAELGGLYYFGFTGGNNYKSIGDGGGMISNINGGSWPGNNAIAAVYFAVDQGNAYFASVMNYLMTHIELCAGRNFVWNSNFAAAGVVDFTTSYEDYDFEAIPTIWYFGNPLQSAAVNQSFLDKILNDIDDPLHLTSTADADASLPNHLETLATGTAQAVTATTLTLASADAGSTNAYQYGIVTDANYDYFGVVDANNAGTKVVSLNPFWLGTITGNASQNPSYVSGVTISGQVLQAATYVSGLIASGSGNCTLSGFNHGGSGATATISINSGTPGAIAINTIGSGFTSAPTTATVASGTATCSGTPVLTSVIGGTCSLTSFNGSGSGATGILSVASGSIASQVNMTAIGVGYSGTVSSAAASNGTATCSGTATITMPTNFWYGVNTGTCFNGTTPTTACPYIVYPGVTASGGYGPYSSGSVVGHGTHFTTYLHAGDNALLGYGWNNHWQQYQTFVTAVTDDTHLSVVNTSAPYLAGTTMSWYLPQWKTGDAGYAALAKHDISYPGGQGTIYLPDGGFTATSPSGNGTAYIGGNTNGTLGAGDIATGLALCAYDARACRFLAQAQSYVFDFNQAWYMSAWTGIGNNGSSYSIPKIGQDQWNQMVLMQNTFGLAWPNQDIFGAGTQATAINKILTAYPDLRSYGSPDGVSEVWPAKYGDEIGQPALAQGTGILQTYVTDPQFMFAPTSTIAKGLRYFLENAAGFNMWSQTGIGYTAGAGLLTTNDPRIPSATYTGWPQQYLFQANSAVTCATLTGGACLTSQQNNFVVSRTSLSNRAATLTTMNGITMWVPDHNQPQQGVVHIYKVGELLSDDQSAVDQPQSGGSSDSTVNDGMIQIGGSGSNVIYGQGSWNAASYAQVDRWWQGNAGSMGTAWGDQASQATCASMNLATVYSTASNYVRRTMCDSKPTGGDEYILVWDTVSLPSPITGGIAVHWHYAQNGETGVSAYPEGTTTFSGGVVTELETGTNDGLGDPPATYGLITNFLSPSGVTTTIHDDNTTYSGSTGHSHRVSVCAGASCGATASTMEVLTVHKIAQNLTDTSLTCTGINPDANWFVGQCAGATSASVFVGARGGTTHATITSFTTTHSGTAQYLFSGITPGTYTITVGGVTKWTGTISSTDSHTVFSSTAGVVVMSSGGGGATSAGTTVLH